MTNFESVPLWLAIPITLFLLIGSSLTLIGTIGFVQLKSFYDRLHVPTLGTSWGTAAILLASMLLASWTSGSVVVHELVIGIFIMVTTPVTLMLLGRAALYRDRFEGKPNIPRPLWLRNPLPEVEILAVDPPAVEDRSDNADLVIENESPPKGTA